MIGIPSFAELGHQQTDQRHFDQAYQTYQDVYHIYKNLYGPKSQQVADFEANLTIFYLQAEHYTDAILCALEALPLLEEV